MSSRSYWCDHAWLGGDRPEAEVLIEVDGDRIAAVEAGVDEQPAGSEHLPGVTIPGLANAHSHAFHRALRGRTQGELGSFWSWRERMYELAAALDPERYHRLARATFGEMALAGFTAVGEFHYLHHGPNGVPYDDPNELGRALVAAADEAGIRITLLDACYLHGGIDEELDPVQQRFSDGDAVSWAERVETLGELGDTGRVGAAIHSVRAVDPGSAATVAAWVNQRSWPLHAHVSEQPAEVEACLAAHGRTPTGVLEDAGAISEGFTAIHFTHATEDDIVLLGERGACACLCPTTERDLADGIGPARRIADAGARLAIGTDSHAVIDGFEEARAVELDQRLTTGERGLHSPAELLRAMTEHGHAAIGWPEAGRIAPGSIADLVTVGLGGARLAGAAAEHLPESLVFAATAADVSDVIVGGAPVVRHRRHVKLDVVAELGDALRELER
jgi:formiminoglutamate deiminase